MHGAVFAVYRGRAALTAAPSEEDWRMTGFLTSLNKPMVGVLRLWFR
jgi:hypothetical protein